MSKHGKFAQLAQEAVQRHGYAQRKGNGLTGNGMIPHELWRRIIPIAREFDRGLADIALLYSYLLSNVNGQSDNDRYMSAFPSVETIADHTCISRNRIARLSDVLVASGLLKTVYDYTGNKRNKLYYPQYYSLLTDDEIRANIAALYEPKASITVE